MLKHDKSILGDILHPNDFVLLLVGIVPGIDISSSANGSRIKQHQNCNLLFGWKLDIFGHGPICLWFLVCVSRFSPYMLVIQPTHLFSGHASSRSALVAGTWRRLGQTKPGNSVILEDFLWVIFTKKNRDQLDSFCPFHYLHCHISLSFLFLWSLFSSSSLSRWLIEIRILSLWGYRSNVQKKLAAHHRWFHSIVSGIDPIIPRTQGESWNGAESWNQMSWVPP